MADFICRYHTRIAGVEPKLHTRHFILQQLQAEILAKIISQIDLFVDHPFLSMMYHDNLFLGICNSAIDNEINGTRDELQILLRFNTLTEHQSTQSASVRYIVHNGCYALASFHTKAFVDDMCRMICESNSEKAKKCRLLSDIPNRSFYDFSLYFDNELFRLSTVAPPKKEDYKPLIPVLWSTMRSTSDDESKQLSSSPSFDVELTTSNNLLASQTSLSNITATTNSSMILNNKMTLQTNNFINYLAEKLPEMFMKLQTENSSSNSNPATKTSTHSSISTDDIVKKEKLLLFSLLNNYLQTMSHVQASTQIIDENKDTKSYAFFCSTSKDT
ncbi:unnamed protein product [Rotaria sp. Silwood1]|nr:unnamed protein product [Rotaria sp. Silwood1]CAF1465118.1 unnamed protein product [Rotaria sp. Silwood1]CAF3695236.1 unnamed protein product [Rotaria sp. Silwood1]CAF3697417.1 unnamed protein product [Rotaria sp. Silwood1]CAF4911756.1 unnamed protein product [Rotaria sp. Silwood1]